MTTKTFNSLLHGGSANDSNIFNKIKSFLSKLNWKIIVIVLIIIAIIIGVYFAYKKRFEGFSEYNENSINSNNNSSGKSAELMLFYVDWCPHCKTAKPEWEQVKTEFQGKSINGYNLMFTEVNCTNESPDVEKMMNTYKIEGYPTIKLLKDSQVIDYDAKPTKATLTQFLNTVL